MVNGYMSNGSQICLRIGIPLWVGQCVPHAPVVMPDWCRAVRGGVNLEISIDVHGRPSTPKLADRLLSRSVDGAIEVGR